MLETPSAKSSQRRRSWRPTSHERPEGTEEVSAQTERAESACEPVGTVVELFAGVGGFRLALEGVPAEFADGLHPTAGYDARPQNPWSVVWANQWEPSTKAQHAFDCYAERFSTGAHVNQDIATVALETPEQFDLLVGGFPCQDYSVAKPLNQAHGIRGRKGVLWWEIHRIIESRRPRFVLLENVDRLLKSPGKQRGRDFAIILTTMSELGYTVEWRVVNAADYGFPQRRRRVFIVGRRNDEEVAPDRVDGPMWIEGEGVLARALPCYLVDEAANPEPDFEIRGDAYEVSQVFGLGKAVSDFKNAGVMVGRRVWTRKVAADYGGTAFSLGDVLEDSAPIEFEIPEDRLGDTAKPAPGTWRYAKFAKNEERVHKASGTPYRYTEGGLPFPDPVDRASRTVLTGEGGTAPSRFKHVVPNGEGRYRRLTPVELERLNGFPDGWTEGMSPVKRAFCMGNALVVGVVRRIGEVLAEDFAVLKSQE